VTDPHRPTDDAPLSQALNAMRWTAAIAVVLTHLDNRIFEPHSAAGGLSGYYVWLFSVGFAHKAVILFFVMSGWLVGGKILKEALSGGDVNLPRYFFDRLSRLWIVLLPAVALTYVLDGLGYGLAADPAIYEHAEPNRTAASLVCNVLFLQTIACPEIGTNGALWSLANEFWYYVLWPLLLAPFMRFRSARFRWGLFFAGCGLCVALSFQRFGTYNVVPYFAIWAIGAFARVLPAPMMRSPAIAAGILVAFLVLTRLLIRSEMVATPLRIFVLDVATALCTANVLVTLNHWQGTLPLIFRLRVHQFLAERSYSLYAIHTPLIMFACALLQSHFSLGWKMEQDDPRVWAVLAGVLMFVILSTWAFAALTEVRTAQIKRALRGRWTGARSKVKALLPTS
jgi:peptidoglycan/LPS O-acetylase OafA/YrhL